jgi:16S rRNA (guanine966-N2)-methyltransferase
MKRRGNELRIIGGQWRGRRFAFPDSEGLRPTGDRVREALFNWLQVYLPGARCLDLFAGSGALGLEALSRGAAGVTFIERSRAVAKIIEDHLRALGTAAGRVLNMDAARYLEGRPEPFDIVFLDPPFGSDIIGNCCARLETGGWLAPGAFIYLEHDRGKPLPALPTNWELFRSNTAGQVSFHLARRLDDSAN